jgi:hypothetical protein
MSVLSKSFITAPSPTGCIAINQYFELIGHEGLNCGAISLKLFKVLLLVDQLAGLTRVNKRLCENCIQQTLLRTPRV